jgi:hypothetical protein
MAGFEVTPEEFGLTVLKKMATTTGLEPATSAVTACHDLETKALTRSAKERKVLKTHRRELLLFPDCSHD